ncbi:MAG: hypothetical protein ACPK7O_05300 [Methanobacterium sp.]
MSKNRKLFSIVLAILMILTSVGAAIAAPDLSNDTNNSNITSTNDCQNRITKNVTNLNATNETNNTINYEDTIQYSIKVNKTSHYQDDYYKVTDLLPAGLQYISHNITGTASNKGIYNATTGNWTGICLDHTGEYAILNILAKVIASCTNITNTATLYSNDHSYGSFDRVGKATVKFFVPCAADLGVTKTVNNTNPNLNDYINIALTATNNGPSNATNVTVTDLLPAGFKFISANTLTGSYDNNTGIWTIGNLLSGATAILNIVAQVVTSNVCINNTANIAGHQYDPYMANNTANASVCVPAQSDLYLNVTAPTQCLGLNDIAQIIFKVGNRGPDTAQNVNMTWVVPQGMEFINAIVDSGNWTYTAATRTLVWYLGDVPVGDPFMWVTVRVLQTGNFLIAPTLTTSTYDPTLGNGTNVQFANICVEAAEQVNAAGGEVFAESVPMQNTGMPIAMLVLAVLAVLGGLIVPRRK